MESNRNEYRGVYKAHSAGWDKLVNPLIDLALDAGITIAQVKEKFGGLRFYVANVPKDRWEEITSAINKAEDASYTTCEQCGEPGKVRNFGWIQTLCDTHADEYIAWKNEQNKEHDDEEEV